MMYQKSVFLFRRDLRLHDNTGLIQAQKESKAVSPLFILDDDIFHRIQQTRRNLIQFMFDSLSDLDGQLNEKNASLVLLRGSPTSVLDEILKENENIQSVQVNADYTPYSIHRDEKIRSVCEENGVTFQQHEDLLLVEPHEIRTSSGTPYKVFTPFYKKAIQKNVPKPKINGDSNFKQIDSKFLVGDDVFDELLPEKNNEIDQEGGRGRALEILGNLKHYKDYEQHKDIPALRATTRLSAHNKFGTCSIREAYWKIADSLGKFHPIIRQLYWRDFFTHVAFHWPHVYEHAFKRKYDAVEWSYNEAHFEKWCSGATGFPIVDAGMRQLNTTGFMHNRVRMIVASFLAKDLHIDWKWGEKYFTDLLIDYDPAVNNGNWQWAASTGCDAQPYFRIFNPWSQQKKFDPDCVYIKRWIPELADVSPAVIHRLDKKHSEIDITYPKAMVDHSKERERALASFKSI